MRENSFYIERVIPLLITGGVFIHLINLSTYLQFGEVRISQILHPVVDAPLAALMCYSAIGVFYWKNFFRKFGITSLWRKVAYFFIAAYVVCSIPGHIKFLLTGDTAFFEQFPWWFSLALMPLYAAIILYFLTLHQVLPDHSERR